MVFRVFGLLLLVMQLVANAPAAAQDASVPTPTTPPVTLPHTYGIVRVVQQWHLVLVDGRTVDLAPGTQIIPTGVTVMPGDRIGVYGGYSRPMVIRAASLTVIREDSSAGIDRVR
jgi:hypothetical protein